MTLLLGYLRDYRKLVVLALGLAAINQIFSLLDPLIFRHVIDEYATRYREYSTGEFFRGVGLLLAAAVGVAFVSRVAKNFQDYFINVITQRLGARLYADGIRHSLALPYQVFEDQRSGETLGILQKARADVEKLISQSINLLFTTLVGIIFVMIYAFYVHWVIAPIFLATVPLLGLLSSVLSRRIKKVQTEIVKETTALAGSTTESLRNIELVKSLGLGPQEVARLNSTTDRILRLELKKVRYLRSLSFVQGTAVNALRTSILFLMLYLIFKQEITVGQFFSLFIYSFFIFGPLQELGNVVNTYRETEASMGRFQQILQMPIEPKPAAPRAYPRPAAPGLRGRAVHAPDGLGAGPGRRELLSAPRRDGRVCRAVGFGEDDAGQAAGRPVPARPPARSSTTATGTTPWTSTRCANGSGSSRRRRSCFRAASARTCCSCVPRPATPSALRPCGLRRATACWRVPTKGSTR